jgi:hypothetical protein
VRALATAKSSVSHSLPGMEEESQERFLWRQLRYHSALLTGILSMRPLGGVIVRVASQCKQLYFAILLSLAIYPRFSESGIPSGPV